LCDVSTSTRQIHIAALGQISRDTPGRAYYLRKQAEGKSELARVTPSGTHRELMGVVPTGWKVAWRVSHCLRFSDGKVIEDRIVFDRAELMEQLGAS
jgi:predicted ester cyclase